MSALVIREEIPADHDAVRDVNRQAFNGDAEADLVDRLRASGAVIVSLVAVKNGEIVGHILFNDITIETDQGGIAAPISAGGIPCVAFMNHGRGMMVRYMGDRGGCHHEKGNSAAEEYECGQ